MKILILILLFGLNAFAGSNSDAINDEVLLEDGIYQVAPDQPDYADQTIKVTYRNGVMSAVLVTIGTTAFIAVLSCDEHYVCEGDSAAGQYYRLELRDNNRYLFTRIRDGASALFQKIQN